MRKRRQGAELGVQVQAVQPKHLYPLRPRCVFDVISPARAGRSDTVEAMRKWFFLWPSEKPVPPTIAARPQPHNIAASEASPPSSVHPEGTAKARSDP